MVSIRKYRPSDFEDVHRISLRASSHPDKTGDDLKYHFFMYTDYYLTCQSDTSFVAEDEQGKVIGYLLCAKDCDAYTKTMQETLIPQLESDILKERASQEVSVFGRYKENYAAHLHIDIDPDFQHGGVGSKLMKALVEDLKAKGVNGVMLGVAQKNTKAIRFYEKNGFDVIEENEFVKTMGLTLNK